MAKKILIVNGHPNKESFNAALAKKYLEGATSGGHITLELILADLNFEISLKDGYQKRSELEPDLISAQEKIKWADHLVIIHPVWWGSLPALFKGFIDRAFLPGFAFKYRENSIWWDKLLSGKTAHIITTLDQPGWYYWLIYGKPSVNQLKKSTLGFCGIKTTKVSYIGIVKDSKIEQRQTWLDKAFDWGKGGI